MDAVGIAPTIDVPASAPGLDTDNYEREDASKGVECAGGCVGPNSWERSQTQ
jgi:hypothetical protein